MARRPLGMYLRGPVPQLLDTPFPGFATLAAEPRASLLIVHGLAEYAGRYVEIARTLSERGISVFAYDQIGHGDRAGKRTHVARFEDFVADLLTAVRAVRAAAPGRPLFLWGHSMGAMVATLAASRSAGALKGVITSSNSLEIFRRARPNPLSPLFRLLSAVAPGVRIPLGLDSKKISSDESVQRAYAADPKIPQTASLRLLVEFAHACEECRETAPNISTPWLVVHGEEDRIAPALGSQLLYDLLGATDKKLVIYPKLRHEVHNELASGREAMLGLMTQWILERSGP